MMAEASSANVQRPQMELLALMGAAQDARKAADDKMRRYLELEEMLSASQEA